MRIATVGVLFALLSFVPAAAAAQSCPVSADVSGDIAGADTAPAGIELGDRARFLERTLARENRRGGIWMHAWGWGLLAATGGQAGVGLLFDDPDDQAVWYVGAAKAGIGSFWTFMFDRPEVSVPRTITTCEQLAAAEVMLVAAARDEHIGWLPRVEGLALNVAALLYLGLVHDRFAKGALGMASSIAIAEFRLYTRPKGAIRALRAYRAGSLTARVDAEESSLESLTLAPRVSASGIGLVVAGSF